MPVSYTHLDVYKRQHYGKSNADNRLYNKETLGPNKVNNLYKTIDVQPHDY